MRLGTSAGQHAHPDETSHTQSSLQLLTDTANHQNQVRELPSPLTAGSQGQKPSAPPSRLRKAAQASPALGRGQVPGQWAPHLHFREAASGHEATTERHGPNDHVQPAATNPSSRPKCAAGCDQSGPQWPCAAGCDQRPGSPRPTFSPGRDGCCPFS